MGGRQVNPYLPQVSGGTEQTSKGKKKGKKKK